VSWKTEAQELRKREAQPPPGCQSLEDVAKEMGVTDETAMGIITKLIKSGRAERVPGKKLTVTGALVTCNYYRLVGKPTAKK
jgi:hypothetical protein